MKAGRGPNTNRPQGANVWTHVRSALQAAQTWRGVDRQRLADLDTAVVRAQGQPDKFTPEDARDILEVVLDGRSAGQFPSGRHGQRRATLSGLEKLLRPTADRAEQISGLPSPESPTASPAPPPAEPQICIQPPPAGREETGLRPYQQEYVTTTVLAMRASADPNVRVVGGGHKDRGLLVSPYQTGKSTMVTPVANAAQRIFPGKRILIVSPFKIITRQMVDDLVEGFNGTIGVVDQRHKEFDRDVTVASALTLERNLMRFNPNEYGLVVIDEMLFSFAPTWQKILRHLGFVDEHGSITPTSEKFLLGLGATTMRRDGRDVRRIFGTQVIADRGLTWFVKNGYLHRPLGLEASYGQSTSDSEVVRREDETIVVMRDSHKNRARIMDTYAYHLNGRKTVIFTVRISEAEHLANDFNRRFGAGYAAVVVGTTPDADANEIVDRFNEGTGPKVLITVKRLAIGARLNDIAGVIFNHRTDSRDKFAQAASRGLARLPGEPQRGVLVITMEGRGHLLDAPQSAGTLAGFEGTTPVDRIYEPLDLARRPIGKIQRGKKFRRRRTAVLRAGAERVRELRVGTRTFIDELQKILNERFGGDVSRMAGQSRIEPAALQSYLHEKLPQSLTDVLLLASRLGVDSEIFERAWIADMQAHLDFEYPIPDELPEMTRRLTELVRLAAIRQTPNGTILALAGNFGINYHILQKYLRGDLPVIEKPLERILDLIVVSGAADESEARMAMWEHVGKRPAETGGMTRDEELVEPEHEKARTELERDETIERALSTLTPREEEILRLRFGFEDGDEKTLDAIGRQTRGISRSAIGIIEERAILKLRHPSRAERLRPYFEGVRDVSEFPPLPDAVERKIGEARALFAEIHEHIPTASQGFWQLMDTMSKLTDNVGDGFIRLQMREGYKLTVSRLAGIQTETPDSGSLARFDESHPWLIESGAPTLVDFWNGVIAIFNLALAREDGEYKLRRLAGTAARNLREILGKAEVSFEGNFRVCRIDIRSFVRPSLSRSGPRYSDSGFARFDDIAARSPAGNAIRGGITMPIGVFAAQEVEDALEGGWRPHDWREELHAVIVAHPSGLAAGLATGTAGQIADAGALRLTGRQTAVLGARVAGRIVSPAANIFLMTIFSDFAVDGRLDMTAGEAGRSALQMTAVTTLTRAPLRAYRAVKAFRQGRRGLMLASAIFTDGAGSALGLFLEETAFQVVDLSILAALSCYERHTIRRAFKVELKREMARFVKMQEDSETRFDGLRAQTRKILTIAATWKRWEEEDVPYMKLDAEKRLEDTHREEDLHYLQGELAFAERREETLATDRRGPSPITSVVLPLSRWSHIVYDTERPETRKRLKRLELGALSRLEGDIRGRVEHIPEDRERAKEEYALARAAIRKAFEKRQRPAPARLANIAGARSVMSLVPHRNPLGDETILSEPNPLFRRSRRSYALTEEQIVGSIPGFSNDPANIFPELETFFRDQAMRAGEQVAQL